MSSMVLYLSIVFFDSKIFNNDSTNQLSRLKNYYFFLNKFFIRNFVFLIGIVSGFASLGSLNSVAVWSEPVIVLFDPLYRYIQTFLECYGWRPAK